MHELYTLVDVDGLDQPTTATEVTDDHYYGALAATSPSALRQDDTP